jgi:NTE family protein
MKEESAGGGMVHEHSRDGNVELDGRPAVVSSHHPLAMVYGGGGVFGVAYTAGVAAGLTEAGIPVADAPALGTSAGAWTAAAFALGLDYEDYGRFDSPSVPNLRPGVLVNLARKLFGDARHPLVSASAVHLPTARRHLLDGGKYPLADLVAASSAVPGLLPPHRIGGRLYVDGGMWSATSVDAAAEADRVIVVAPLAGTVLGPMGRTAGFLLSRELQRWRRRHPDADIELIHPDDEMARVAGTNPLGIFDPVRAREVYPLAFEQGVQSGRRLVSRRGRGRPRGRSGPAA